MSQTVSGPAPSLDSFFETVHAFHRTAALKAAIELDIFTAIDLGATTSEALAAKCGAAERGMRILCDYLAVIGWLSKSGQNYALTPEGAAFTSKRSPQYIGTAIQFLLSNTQTEAFNNLTAAVRNGGSAAGAERALAPDHPMWVEFARSMMPLMGFPSELLAQKVAGGLPQAKCRVLDIAAGHGLYGIAVARHHAQAEITAVDWPSVLSVAKENAQKAGVDGRYHTLPGSAFEVSFGQDYDLVLITNFLHHFDPATCRKFLEKVYAALKPGGRAAILEFVPNEDRVTPAVPASFSLMMLVTTPAGEAYPYSQYKALLQQAGFRSSEVQPLPPTFFSTVIAVK